jgi:DNA polymerase-1
MIYLIDGNNYLYRAYYAFKLTTKANEEIQAIYGFIRTVLKFLRQKPELLVVCFDSPVPTFRHIEYKEYKTNRKKIEPSLRRQVSIAKEIIKYMDIPVIEKSGYEADDVIATLSKMFANEGKEVTIVSSDKDVLQLVSDNVYVYNEAKDILFDREKVVAAYGVEPQELVYVFALMGDSSDNIIGVPGVGEKKAVRIVQSVGKINSIEDLMNRVEKKVKEEIEPYLETIKRNIMLIKLVDNVELDIEVDKISCFKNIIPEKLIEILQKYEFHSILSDPLFDNIFKRTKVEPRVVSKNNELEELIAKVKDIGKFAIYFDCMDGGRDKILSIGLSIGDMTYFIELASTIELNISYVMNRIKEIFESGSVVKICHNCKALYGILENFAIQLRGNVVDIMLLAYLLNPGKGRYSLEDIVFTYLQEKLPTVSSAEKEAISKIMAQKYDIFVILGTVEKSYIEKISSITHAIFSVGVLLEKLAKEKNLYPLYCNYEIPLSYVLYLMEKRGIMLDLNYLQRLKEEFSFSISEMEKKIYTAVGTEFNINSPKQLSFILFEKLQLPKLKKTKKGQASTNEEVLQELSHSYEVPKMILEYRELQKIQTTYIAPLLELANSNDFRVHTTFHQTGTATGRLSSTNPNLQNIPIRTELGRKIRKAFIAKEGSKLISCDYSQIDLRVLAHMSKDKVLIEAFMNNQDIHNTTACEIFGITQDKITPEIRRVAKVINFGIIYGMTAQGLSAELKIPHALAQEYIDRYFDKYKGVREWIEYIKRYAKENGFVETILKRRRYIPEINSKDPLLESYGERVAINTPIQGSASDIIKVAMLKIHDFLHKNFSTYMVVQIHDELLFEAPEDELNMVLPNIKNIMETAIKLDIPLVVNVKVGKNWAELEEINFQ